MISSKSAQKLIDLANQWETKRVPLIDEYRKARDALMNKKDDGKTKLQKIKEMMQQRKIFAKEVEAKNERYTQLLNYYKSLPKDVNRSFYTRRILDILKNVKKLKAEMDKILIDTRNLMKEIGLVTDTLKRSFTVTDELMFADAKKDEIIKQAYKDLVAMDKSFSNLVTTVEETGAVHNAILELKVKIEQNEGITSKLNTARLAEDLNNVKQENSKLQKQLRGVDG